MKKIKLLFVVFIGCFLLLGCSQKKIDVNSLENKKDNINFSFFKGDILVYNKYIKNNMPNLIVKEKIILCEIIRYTDSEISIKYTYNKKSQNITINLKKTVRKFNNVYYKIYQEILLNEEVVKWKE